MNKLYFAEVEISYIKISNSRTFFVFGPDMLVIPHAINRMSSEDKLVFFE